jgi:hypothetical protein
MHDQHDSLLGLGKAGYGRWGRISLLHIPLLTALGISSSRRPRELHLLHTVVVLLHFLLSDRRSRRLLGTIMLHPGSMVRETVGLREGLLLLR